MSKLRGISKTKGFSLGLIASGMALFLCISFAAAQQPPATSQQVLPATTTSQNQSSVQSQPPPESTEQSAPGAPNTGQTTPVPPSPNSAAKPAVAVTHDGDSNSITQKTIQVTLIINDTNKGNVSLAANSNQCQVLQAALAADMISSLKMKYFPEHSSEGVFEIDGIGDSDQIHWVYTVNGNGAPGCSRKEAKNGDVVHWEYDKELGG